MDQNKKITLIVVVILVIAVFVLWGYKRDWNVKKINTTIQQTPSNNSIKDLPVTEVPPGIPKDIILPKDANVLHSFTAVTGDGQNQSSLIYTTTELNLIRAYIEYFAKNGWAIEAGPNGQLVFNDGSKLRVRQAGKVLSVNIFKDSKDSSQQTVAINLLSSQQ